MRPESVRENILEPGLDWAKSFWRLAASNSARNGVRVVSGFFVFRMLYSHFTVAEFGFYGLLWSMFGYTLLLDFGIGMLAKKESARVAADGYRDVPDLNEFAATCFWCFLGVGLVVFLLGAAGTPYFLRIVQVPEPDWPNLAPAYLAFVVALSLSFPLGFLPEMLTGVQRGDAYNWMITACTALSPLIIYYGLNLGWSYTSLISVGLAASVLPRVFSGLYLYHVIPNFSLKPGLIRISSLARNLNFSVSTYLLSVTSLLNSRSDQMVIGGTLGVRSVAPYQAGAKCGEMFALFFTQVHDALLPAAAYLAGRNDEASLKRLLIGSVRMTLLITPLYGITAIYMRALILVITGTHQCSTESLAVGEILLASLFSSMITDRSTVPLLLMSGYERLILYFSMISAAANIGLSFLLVGKFGVVGVALGTMIPTVLIGWVCNLRLAARFAGLDLIQLLGECLRPIWRGILGSGLALAIVGSLYKKGYSAVHFFFIGAVFVIVPLGRDIAATCRDLTRKEDTKRCAQSSGHP